MRKHKSMRNEEKGKVLILVLMLASRLVLALRPFSRKKRALALALSSALVPRSLVTEPDLSCGQCF